MPAKAFLLSAAGSVTWTPTQDVSVNGFQYFATTAARAVLSYDPNISIATVGAPAAAAISDTIISAQLSSAGLPAVFNVFPVKAGEGVTVSVTGAGTAVIYYELAV